MCLLSAGVPMPAFYSAATLECHVAAKRHDTQSLHNIQTYICLVLLFSIHVEHPSHTPQLQVPVLKSEVSLNQAITPDLPPMVRTF